MQIKLITDQNYQKIWDDFVINNSSPAAFLQSFAWGEFRQKEIGEKILRLAVYDSTLMNTDGADEHNLIAVAQFIYQKLPLGKKYLFCPRGIIIDGKRKKEKGKVNEILNLIVSKIKKIAKEEKVVFARIEPPFDCHSRLPRRESGELIGNLGSYGNTHGLYSQDPRSACLNGMAGGDDKPSVNNVLGEKPRILIHSKNPENTLLLDLSKTEEEILVGMHPKWRYNIRLAEKKNIKIRNQKSEIRNLESDINSFYSLLQETAKRDGIKIFSKKYYESLVNYFGCHSTYRLSAISLTAPSVSLTTRVVKHEAPPSQGRDNNAGSLSEQQLKEPRIDLFFAEYNNKILSAIMLLGFGDTLTYLHGGSSNDNREVMPNHAIQWAAIKFAKEQGYRYYDFWGINNDKRQKEKGKKNAENDKDNWGGITRFKMGFVNEQTGKEINYAGAKDLVVNRLWYNLYRIGKIIKF